MTTRLDDIHNAQAWAMKRLRERSSSFYYAPQRHLAHCPVERFTDWVLRRWSNGNAPREVSEDCPLCDCTIGDDL